MHGEAQGHDMSVMFGKLQGGGILRQESKSMRKKSTVNSR